LKIKHSIL